ncbi:MAG: heat-inducible transcription repressor HrcA [Lachnospiraceae bacterium]|nr:heat-inducible transcription repressor HrcA [Lachnospiraceae bacterium]
MEMDERKTKILLAIIKNYLDTGEPVGSRTISKDTDLNLSSATIRNEMADLEEMGYILQPHTSAGRIPSDKGYRFYVDSLMEAKEREVADMKDMLLERQDKLEDMLKSVVRALARDTQYATMITAPTTHRNKLKFIQLSRVDREHLLAVVVIEGNVIRNRMIDIAEEVNDETLLKLNMLLNTQLNGLAIEEINLSMVAKLKQQAGIHSGVIGDVIDEVVETLSEDKDLEVYTSGANNIFKYPELADNENASKLITAFEEKQLLGDIIHSEDASEETGIQVYIGGENKNSDMQDCSVVTAVYDLGDGMKGTIGIVGPRRMDYEKVVGTLKSIKTNLDDLYRKQ